jgi:pimeloyl-ACP methyl ester carboxylesterase
MGQYCRIGGRIRPNQKLSAKGHRTPRLEAEETAVVDAGSRFIARGGSWKPTPAQEREILRAALDELKCARLQGRRGSAAIIPPAAGLPRWPGPIGSIPSARLRPERRDVATPPGARRAMGLAAALLFCCGQAPAAERIEVHCRGEGQPLYLIGGGPAFTTWHLEAVQERLAEGYRVCRWDMRGVGDNARLPLKPGLSALAQWLEDMREVLPPEPATLWGHSWGALQALLFARRYPERVSRLILSNPVDPALHGLEHIEQKRFVHPGDHARLALEDIGTPAEDLHNLRSKVASYFVDAGRGWAYASRFTRADADNRLNVRIWDDYRQTPLADADVRRLAAKIGGLIYCRADVLQPESLAEYRRLLPGARHQVLTGCAHFPWEEDPDAYFAILRRLLNER